MVTITSGMPKAYLSGINDKSRRTVQNEPEVLPTHLPKVYTFAKTGPLTPELVVGNSRVLMYGEETWDERSKYATHATVLSNRVNSYGNAQMIQRVIPEDAGPKSTIRLSIDLLATQVPVYERMSDGSYALDEDGLKIQTGETIPGFVGMWTATKIPAGQFGLATQKPGAQTDGTNQSISYPIGDFEVPHFGADGNNTGLRIWSQSIAGLDPLDDRILTNEGVYPFRMTVLRRDDELSTGRIHRNLFNETSVQVCFKPDTVDRNTETLLYAGDVFLQAYQDLDNPVAPPQYGPFGAMHLYNASIEEVLAKVYEEEKLYADEFADIFGDDVEAEKFLINIIGGHTSQGTPYHAFQLKTVGADVVRLSENSVFYAEGGSDGTMNEQVFAELVAKELDAYADPNSELMDMTLHPESIIYDSGFPLATKYALCKFISVRKDTMVVLATHDTQGRTLTASQESSLALALRTRLQLYPESEIHGTHVCRGMIVGRSGKMIGTRYQKRLPLTLEIAAKAADYMGASNGRWKAGRSFDSAPLSEVSNFTDINVTFTPDSVRNKDWANCLVWVQAFKRKTVFFPALKTVYNDDTSVLNSFFTVMACVELEKVGFRSWKQFTGSDKRSNAVLKKDVEKWILDDVKDRFDNRFIIIPEVYFTERDIERGYSWSTRIKLGADNMKTVNAFELESYRRADLES